MFAVLVFNLFFRFCHSNLEQQKQNLAPEYLEHLLLSVIRSTKVSPSIYTLFTVHVSNLSLDPRSTLRILEYFMSLQMHCITLRSVSAMCYG